VRIAVVLPLVLGRHHVGKDVFLIPEGLASLGHDVTVHAPGADGSPWPVPVRVSSSLDDPSYWRADGARAAIVFTHLRQVPLLRAVRAAGVFVVGKADTDGLLSARLHTRATFARAALEPEGLPGRAAAVAHWAGQLGPLHRAETAKVAASIDCCDEFVVETDPTAREVRRLLEYDGFGEQAARVRVITNPVAPVFARGGGPKEDLVVAAGRWEAGQKNARLLARALERFLAAHPSYRAHVIGPGFPAAPVTRDDHLSQPAMADVFARARIVVSSSRWESFALAVHEALAMGASFAGPPLPAFRQIVELGPYGTLMRGRGPGALAAAMGAEARAWAAGGRDAAAIASFWRERLDVANIARQFEALLPRT
jgi:glycosyltransferase involved in cell wall biosynthesis